MSEKQTGALGESPQDGIPPVVLFKCDNSHTFFHRHEVCPVCKAPLESIECPPVATLVTHTTVRIGPNGSPFKLGLARVESGAQTLCIIEGDADEVGVNEVVVYKKDDLYYAVPKIG